MWGFEGERIVRDFLRYLHRLMILGRERRRVGELWMMVGLMETTFSEEKVEVNEGVVFRWEESCLKDSWIMYKERD